MYVSMCECVSERECLSASNVYMRANAHFTHTRTQRDCVFIPRPVPSPLTRIFACRLTFSRCRHALCILCAGEMVIEPLVVVKYVVFLMDARTVRAQVMRDVDVPAHVTVK